MGIIVGEGMYLNDFWFKIMHTTHSDKPILGTTSIAGQWSFVVESTCTLYVIIRLMAFSL